MPTLWIQPPGRSAGPSGASGKVSVGGGTLGLLAGAGPVGRFQARAVDAYCLHALVQGAHPAWRGLSFRRNSPPPPSLPPTPGLGPAVAGNSWWGHGGAPVWLPWQMTGSETGRATHADLRGAEGHTHVHVHVWPLGDQQHQVGLWSTCFLGTWALPLPCCHV